MCQVTFQTVQEQREHVKSDHHRYNLKSRLRGTAALTEAEFNKAVGELDESISGSESASSDQDADGAKTPDTTLTALLKRQAKISEVPESENYLVTKKRGSGKHPLLWFSSPLLSPTISLGVYRALFTDIEQAETDHLVESLRNKQVQATPRQSGQVVPGTKTANRISQGSPHVFLCMIGGGHFAAMIVGLAPEIHKTAGGIEERRARVLAHKTFHRYTTRRKQGGTQSANDAAKGAAHSAGSTLRRYNEAALETEIRQLLGDWKSMIDGAQSLFVRAAGTTNRRIIFGPYEGQVLRQSDPRLRGFPFTTRRATQAELIRAFTELTRVKISHIESPSPVAEEPKHQDANTKSPKPLLSREKPKIPKEEEAAMLHTSQIQALIRRSKAPALLSYLSNNSIPPSFTFHTSDSQQNYHSPTPLHLAASSGSPAIVLALLTKANADPTLLNGEGKLPFDLASDRATRDAFRVARHELGEAVWNWEAAHVPSAISKAEADSRGEREKKAAEEAEANRRRAETERLRREEAQGAVQRGKRTGGRALATVEKTAAEKREEEMRGMSGEMRMRLERERRARAAEERIRRMQGGT